MPPTLITFAGNGINGFGGDGGNPGNAALSTPGGVAVDANGNVYIADTGNHRIRKVTAGPSPTITTVAGNGVPGFSGDGGDPLAASLNTPFAVALDGAGNLYIADTGNDRIRKVTFSPFPAISTVAGGAGEGYCGDGGPAAAACLFAPFGVAVDSSGNLYIADTVNQRIREVTFTPVPLIVTVAGNGSSGYSGDGGPPTLASLSYPNGVAVDAARNIYIGDSANNVIRGVSNSTGTLQITTFAGDGSSFYGSDDNLATYAGLNGPGGISVDRFGNAWFTDTYASSVRLVLTGSEDIITTLPPGPNGFSTPYGVALDSHDNLYIADTGNSVIREAPGPTALTVRVAGVPDCFGFYEAPGLNPYNACFQASDVAVDSAGSLYIADAGNHRIRKVTFGAAPAIATIAGNGSSGFCGDGGNPLDACVSPSGLVFDSRGNLYVAEQSNQRIRKITFGPNATITTVAGNGTQGFCGDGGNPLDACFNYPEHMAFDSLGNLYVADLNNERVREITFGLFPVIRTVAGNGQIQFCGNDGSPTSVCMNPDAVALDSYNNLYIADSSNNIVWEVAAGGAPAVTILAGNHGVGLCGDGGPAVDACVAQPSALAFNGGSLYVQTPGYLRKISLGATPVISSVAGPLPQRSCTDGFAAGSCFNVFSGGLAFGPLGELYILDYGNYTVNKITNLQ